MKRFIALLALLFTTFSALADGVALTSLTSGAASNLLSGVYIVDQISVVATTTNITTLKFYDSSTTATSYVAAAYTKYTGYATNFSNVFTNENSLLVTNTYAGWYTGATSVGAATNTRPVVYSIVAPASSILTKDVKIQTIRGLTVVPNQDCQVILTYRTAN